MFALTEWLLEVGLPLLRDFLARLPTYLTLSTFLLCVCVTLPGSVGAAFVVTGRNNKPKMIHDGGFCVLFEPTDPRLPPNKLEVCADTRGLVIIFADDPVLTAVTFG